MLGPRCPDPWAVGVFPQPRGGVAAGTGLELYLPPAVLELNEQLAGLVVLTRCEALAPEGSQHLLDVIDRVVAAGGVLVGEAHLPTAWLSAFRCRRTSITSSTELRRTTSCPSIWPTTLTTQTARRSSSRSTACAVGAA
ncbi:hypothetical protein G6F68_015917 [Rhizopus microsporus]|nr:hypothetical protein G6F68_015917 [Rhizopus microsporus]